jgi:hypothetical protein
MGDLLFGMITFYNYFSFQKMENRFKFCNDCIPFLIVVEGSLLHKKIACFHNCFFLFFPSLKVMIR